MDTLLARKLAMVLCLSASLPPRVALSQAPQTKWGKFSSHPARKFFEQAVRLSDTDARMLGLVLLQIEFDAARFSKQRAFATYFTEYNRASDEFQRNKLINGIRERFVSRQQQLASVRYVSVIMPGALGEYSFQDQGFAFPRSGSSIAEIDNFFNHRDETLFPRIVRIDQKEAERIVRATPSRRVDVLAVVKPVGGGTTGAVTFLDLGIAPLVANAVVVAIRLPSTGEVIAVYPSQESITDQLFQVTAEYQTVLSQLANSSSLGDTVVERASKVQLEHLKQRRDTLKSELAGFGWQQRSAVDSIESGIQGMLEEKRRVAESALSSGSVYEGQADDGIGHYPIRIRFISLDHETGRFVGEMEWPALQSTQKIEGELSSDELGPRIAFDETAVIGEGAGATLRSGYALRLKGAAELYGISRGLVLRVSPQTEAQRAAADAESAERERKRPKVLLLVDASSLRIRSHEYQAYAFTIDGTADCRVEGNVVGLRGGQRDVEVYVFTDEDFLKWTRHLSFESPEFGLYRGARQSVGCVSVPLPGAGKYHVVISNAFSVLNDKIVQAQARVTCTGGSGPLPSQ